MQAVREDREWYLAFPLAQAEFAAEQPNLQDTEKFVWREWPEHEGYVVNDAGLVACRIYKHVPARRMWDLIMASTYDFAEPGFILIDRVNEMNNNWWCENIRATNPCVTADTWVHTSEGPRQVGQLLGREIAVRLDGQDHPTTAAGFFQTGCKPVVRLRTVAGHSLRLTADHRLRRVTELTRWSRQVEWCAAGDLQPGDRVLLNDHRANPHWPGRGTRSEGYLLGLLMGDGVLKSDKAVLSVWHRQAQAVGAGEGPAPGVRALMSEALAAAQTLPHRSDFDGWHAVGGRAEHRLSLAALRELAESFGMAPGAKLIAPALEQASSECQRGFLRGLFDADGSVQGDQSKGVSVRLAQSDLERLEAVQRMLLRLGIVASIYRNRRLAGASRLPDGKGGSKFYATLPQHELVLSGENLAIYAELIGFGDSDKQLRLQVALASYRRRLHRERFTAVVESVTAEGDAAVYDVQVPGVHAFDANGLHAHNCGEQPLAALTARACSAR